MKCYEDRLLQRLTRYLSFPKYVDFLLSGVFAPNLKVFEDPLEGHVVHSLRARPENRKAIAATIDRAKTWVYASCWHGSDAESYAMWRIYGQQQDAVAIHTTFDRLSALMANYAPGPRDPIAILTTVFYADPVNGEFPVLDQETIYSRRKVNLDNEYSRRWGAMMQTYLATKPTAYAYEREVRLLLLDGDAPEFPVRRGVSPPQSTGLRLETPDLNGFLTGVTVAPYAPEWFVAVVTETSERFGLDLSRVPVERSKMYDGPL